MRSSDDAGWLTGIGALYQGVYDVIGWGPPLGRNRSIGAKCRKFAPTECRNILHNRTGRAVRGKIIPSRTFTFGLQRGVVGLAGANAQNSQDVGDKNLAVADLPGFRSADYGLHHLIDE